MEPKHDHDAKADCAEKDFWGNHHQAGDAQYNTSDFLQMATEIFEQRGTDSDNAEDGGHNREHDLERDAANYIMMSMITVPAVTSLGVNTISAHLFCFYYGIVSDLTPPVALAALTGAGIAKAKFWPTAFNATKLGIGAYLVPFFFVYNPILLLGQYSISLEVGLRLDIYRAPREQDDSFAISCA